MSRIFFALSAAAFMTMAVPASALSVQVDLPNLTYPPLPSPDASQGCSDLTKLSGETCIVTSK